MERRHRKPDEAQKGVISEMFYRTETETVALEVGLNSINLQVTLFPGKNTRHELHHSRIRV